MLVRPAYGTVSGRKTRNYPSFLSDGGSLSLDRKIRLQTTNSWAARLYSEWNYLRRAISKCVFVKIIFDATLSLESILVHGICLCDYP